MKKFFVVAKKSADLATIPPAATLAVPFNVKWTSSPDGEWRLAQRGQVSEEEFFKLQSAFEDSGFYSMYEDIEFHTVN